MFNLKETLLSLDGFINNEYLDKYCRLIELNTRTTSLAKRTNSHHIIPKAWFKINNKPINNDKIKLVNLEYRNHVLAHYFLCLCTKDQLKYANELALICLVNRKKLNSSDKRLVMNLPLYNNIYEDYKLKQQNNYKLYGGK